MSQWDNSLHHPTSPSARVVIDRVFPSMRQVPRVPGLSLDSPVQARQELPQLVPVPLSSSSSASNSTRIVISPSFARGPHQLASRPVLPLNGPAGRLPGTPGRHRSNSGGATRISRLTSPMSSPHSGPQHNLGLAPRVAGVRAMTLDASITV